MAYCTWSRTREAAAERVAYTGGGAVMGETASVGGAVVDKTASVIGGSVTLISSIWMLTFEVSAIPVDLESTSSLARTPKVI